MQKIEILTNPVEVFARVQQCYANKQEALFGGVSDVDFTTHGAIPGTSKKSELKDRNFLQCSYLGGTCIGYAGNVFICAVTKTRSTYIYKLCQLIKNFLATKGIEAQVTGNDVVYRDENGAWRKVASGGNCGSLKDSMFSAAFQVSIHIDEEYVKNVCTKAVKKIPSSLDRFGITGEEVFEYIQKHIDDNGVITYVI